MSQSVLTGLAPVLAIVDGIPTTTSVDVARHFGKQHDDVLRRVRTLIADAPSDFNARNFAAVDYTDAKGENRPTYRLTRDGFTLLAMGFTGKRALQFKLAYIDAFNRMETQLRSPAPPAPPALKKIDLTDLDGERFLLTHKDGRLQFQKAPENARFVDPHDGLSVAMFATLLSSDMIRAMVIAGVGELTRRANGERDSRELHAEFLKKKEKEVRP